MKALRIVWLLLLGVLMVPATDAGAPGRMLHGSNVVPQANFLLLLPAQIHEFLLGAAEPTKLMFLGGLLVVVAIALRQRMTGEPSEESI